jgi:hypothetical protein
MHRWFCDTQSSRRKKLLSEESQRLFLAKEFVSFEFKELSPEQEEDLFARVQMGVQLSVAEKMRASTGPWQELARLFVDDFPLIYSLMKDRARAKDFQLTLSCFSQIVEVMYPTTSDGVPILKTNYNALPKLLSNKGAVDDGLKSHLANVWNTFKHLIEQDINIFTNVDKYLHGVQTFAPVEMVAVTVLISLYSGKRNRKLLLGDIKAMRETIRENFADIRMNAPVWKFVWNFIEDLESRRGATDGSTAPSKMIYVAKPSANTKAVVSQSSTAPMPNMAKRGRCLLKTKASTILPPEQPFSVKKEVKLSAPSKRQRTGYDLTDTVMLVEQPSHRSPNAHLFESHLCSPAPRTMNSALTQPQCSTMPIHASISDNSRSSLRANPWRDVSLPNADVSKEERRLNESPVSRESISNRYSPYATTPTPCDLSSVTLQTRLAGTITDQAPTAPTAASGPATSNQQVPKPPMKSSSVSITTSPTYSLSIIPSHHRKPSPKDTPLSTGLGAFSPRHTPQQWAGVIRSSSPPGMSSSNVLSSNNRSIQKPHKAHKPPTPAPYNDSIDLTSDSDSEQERQDLLSSFKAKTPVEKRKQTTARPMAAIDTTPLPMVN